MSGSSNSNPLDLLSWLDRLITEHGSAAIQEKHIALLREQITALLLERDRLLQENAVLAEKNAKLVSENQQLRERAEEREIADAKAHEADKERQRQDRDRTDEEYAILAVIVKRRAIAAFGIGLELGYMRGQMSERITHLLKGLRPLVWESAESHWSLTDRGRDHLFTRGRLE